MPCCTKIYVSLDSCLSRFSPQSLFVLRSLSTSVSEFNAKRILWNHSERTAGSGKNSLQTCGVALISFNKYFPAKYIWEGGISNGGTPGPGQNTAHRHTR